MSFKEYIETKYKLTLEEPFSYYNAQWLSWAEEYAKVQNQELIDFLLEIEAWLTFNQTPNIEETAYLRNDIKRLLNLK